MLDDSASLLASHGVAALSDECQVAASFSHVAASYSVVAEPQHGAGESLLSALPEGFSPCRWVDPGCGTGHSSRALECRFGAAKGLAVDIAEGMLRYAHARGGASHLIDGDAERSSLRDGSCDLLFPSLTIQWCADLPVMLAEARRVLRPGGMLAFSSLCVGILGELRDSWRVVDGFVHVNHFHAFANYLQHAADGGLLPPTLRHEDWFLHFPDLHSLTHELKALGAHNLNPGRPDDLTGRQRIRVLVAAYERFRQPEGLPATYRVVFSVSCKDCWTMPALFVTGTDTEIGKTTIVAGLLHTARRAGLSTAMAKPVAFGCESMVQGLRNGDALALLGQCSPALAYEQVNPLTFAPTIVPHLAAREAGVELSAACLHEAVREVLASQADFTLVKGAGGWHVSSLGHENLPDLACLLALPVVSMVGMRPGCINHAPLSAEAILGDGLALAGWVANVVDPATSRLKENLAILAECLPAPCLGRVPRLEKVTPEAAAVHLDLRPLGIGL